MSVVVEGDRITVEPDDVSVEDFLEYAELAIERFGWRQGERVETQDDDMEAVAETDGLSLHDAIGYTNVMLGGDNPGKPTGKDSATSTVSGSRSMRNEMTKAVTAALPKTRAKVPHDDKTFNDKAKDVDEVLDVLRKARGAK